MASSAGQAAEGGAQEGPGGAGGRVRGQDRGAEGAAGQGGGGLQEEPGGEDRRVDRGEQEDGGRDCSHEADLGLAFRFSLL